jgi:hypothetical protein
LMKRMDRKHGKWGTIHPRHRLLEALFGFTKYRETSMAELQRCMAELQRWRDQYKNVGKKQRKVYALGSAIMSHSCQQSSQPAF